MSSYIKVSALPVSDKIKHFLLVMQREGIKALGGKVPVSGMSASDVALIGIASFITEHNFGDVNTIVEAMEEAK